MKKIILFISACFLYSCTNYGQLQVQAQLPKVLKEVSGIQYSHKEQAFWMLNDSGNKSVVYLVSEKGKVQRKLKVDAKNNDWEDITLDATGNLYIGDFGNNGNQRKDLRILKIKTSDLDLDTKVAVEKIEFYFPEQKKFPPKKKKRYYDTEAFFAWNGFFYLFTKSRVKGDYGKTFVYQIPNKAGNHKAKLVSEFSTCKNSYDCAITGADISKDGKKIALITHQAAWICSNFTAPYFFSGKVKEYRMDYVSQKESITFKNDSTLFIADEQKKIGGRNLYLYPID